MRHMCKLLLRKNSILGYQYCSFVNSVKSMQGLSQDVGLFHLEIDLTENQCLDKHGTTI